MAKEDYVLIPESWTSAIRLLLRNVCGSREVPRGENPCTGCPLDLPEPDCIKEAFGRMTLPAVAVDEARRSLDKSGVFEPKEAV